MGEGREAQGMSVTCAKLERKNRMITHQFSFSGPPRLLGGSQTAIAPTCRSLSHARSYFRYYNFHIPEGEIEDLKS